MIAPAPVSPLRCDPSDERVAPDEAKIAAELTRTMRGI
jgi:hypothetical protein